MQIEAGKFYKTRDGRKAGPVYVSEYPDNGPWQADLSAEEGWCYDSDGKLTNFGNPMNEDLVAEWSEPNPGPVITETITRRRIVPGVYGRLTVFDGQKGLAYSLNGNCYLTPTELDELAATATVLAEALRDAEVVN